MAYKHEYKLKLTVNGQEYLAPVTWTNALDSVFNKRLCRRQDYGTRIFSNQKADSLSGYMTYGIGIHHEDELPIVPKDVTFDWKGYREQNYSNFSGTINKVALMCENLVRNDDYYDQSNTPIYCFTDTGAVDVIAKNWFEYNNDEEDVIYKILSFEPNGNCIIGACLKYSGYKDANKIIKVLPKGARWGLDGRANLTIYQKLHNQNPQMENSISLSDINHNYTYNYDAIDEMVDFDEQTESTIIEGQNIEYNTWNCILYARNDHYGTTGGTTITHDDNYIYVIEYLMSKVIRIGQYNRPSQPYSQYAFKPSNCDYYYNMTTRKLEGLDTIDFTPFINVKVIDKDTFDIVNEGRVNLSDVSVDLAQVLINFEGVLDTSEYEHICLNENTTTDAIIENLKLPFRMFAACVDNTYIYLTSGYGNTVTKLVKIEKADLLGASLPGTISVSEITPSGTISDFCHTIDRKNLFVSGSYYGDNTSENYIVNKNTNICNYIGFINWLVSGECEFENIAVSAGDTIKFELIEDIVEVI